MEPQKGDEAPPVKAKDKSPRPHWVSIVIPLATAMIGLVGGILFSRYNSRLQYLDYLVSQSGGIFKRPELGGRQLQITVDGKPVGNVSTTSVYVYNNSSQDYENVPLIVKLKSKDGKPLSLLFSRSTFDPVQKGSTQPAGDGTLSMRYEVPVANRVDNHIFGATYTVEGEDAPEIAVGVEKKGVEIRPLSAAKEPIVLGAFGSSLILVFVLTLGALLATFERLTKGILKTLADLRSQK